MEDQKYSFANTVYMCFHDKTNILFNKNVSKMDDFDWRMKIFYLTDPIINIYIIIINLFKENKYIYFTL